jgi:hypothetical protein
MIDISMALEIFVQVRILTNLTDVSFAILARRIGTKCAADSVHMKAAHLTTALYKRSHRVLVRVATMFRHIIFLMKVSSISTMFPLPPNGTNSPLRIASRKR